MNRTTLAATAAAVLLLLTGCTAESDETEAAPAPVSYTHLRAHET